MGKIRQSILLGVLIAPVFIAANTVSADTVFDPILTDGELVVRSAPPRGDDDASFILGEYVAGLSDSFSLDVSGCNTDYTSCTIDHLVGGHVQGSQEVPIRYIYDKDIKAISDSYIAAIPARFMVGDFNTDRFLVKDLEIINFWANGAENLINYSGEFKSYLGYKNYKIDVRAGNDAEFLTERLGVANFIYNNTSYYTNPVLGVKAEHIIYVPEKTASSQEALIAAAQSRIDAYIGKNKVEVEYAGTVADYIAPFLEPSYEYYDYYNAAYNDEDGELYFLQSATNGLYFNAVVGTEKYNFIIIKSSNANDLTAPKYVSSDISSDITISTESGLIPLDALISVERMAGGKEYERIMNALAVDNSETFDLKLLSSANGSFATKLADGTFEVRIPIESKFAGKNLTVYYVDEDGAISEHAVITEGSYAIFKTNHFSPYTLAEKASIANPNTNDRIVLAIAIAGVSFVGLIVATIFLAKKIRREN